MGFIAAEIIKKKRDGQPLTLEEIEWFIFSYTNGTIPDYQASALLMAILFRGMTTQETHALTQTMLKSGVSISFPEINKYKVDKHSTGGVGDKTSLLVAPIVAAADVCVPMMAGRGLGHTGGTLDKLESIPGFKTQQSLEAFRKLLNTVGVAIIGQTKEICPADKKMYSLRDVTATVESVPLICASIMSKKLAEGSDGLVLDVKFGNGAFMKSAESAENLARNLKSIGELGGKSVIAFLTDMNQPLGRMVGNSLEVEECVSILSRDSEFNQYADCELLSVQLAGAMLFLAKKAGSIEDGYEMAQDILESGMAMEKFEEMCKAQGGNLKGLPKAPYFEDVAAEKSGSIRSFDTEGVGYASLLLGAGRIKQEDDIDPVAGIKIYKKIGEKVAAGEPLCRLYASDRAKFKAARERYLKSVYLQNTRTSPPVVIRNILV